MAVILSEYTTDEDIIVVGLLHDVLEDVRGYTDYNLIRDAGEKVYQIVKEVTEDRDLGEVIDIADDWQRRKKDI